MSQYLAYERVTVSNAVKTVADLTIPVGTVAAELQADTNPIRYVMDGSTAPTTSTGMVLLITEPPRQFSVSELRNAQFIRSGGSDGYLNIHYIGRGF